MFCHICIYIYIITFCQDHNPSIDFFAIFIHHLRLFYFNEKRLAYIGACRDSEAQSYTDFDWDVTSHFSHHARK